LADYIGKDVRPIQWNSEFQTILIRASRGLCGHSMGGNGAAQSWDALFADTFSAVLCAQPCSSGLACEIFFSSHSCVQAHQPKLKVKMRITKRLVESDQT